jgi:hypothetical protein
MKIREYQIARIGLTTLRVPSDLEILNLLYKVPYNDKGELDYTQAGELVIVGRTSDRDERNLVVYVLRTDDTIIDAPPGFEYKYIGSVHSNQVLHVMVLNEWIRNAGGKI